MTCVFRSSTAPLAKAGADFLAIPSAFIQADPRGALERAEPRTSHRKRLLCLGCGADRQARERAANLWTQSKSCRLGVRSLPRAAFILLSLLLILTVPGRYGSAPAHPVTPA